MTARGRYALAALVGGVLFAGHLVGYPALMEASEGQSLQVRSAAPRIADALDTEAVVPAGVRERVTLDVRPGGPAIDGPGMHRLEWAVRYRGGYERRVGRTQLVGPFQDPAAPPCGLRVILGQRLLDGISEPRTGQPGPLEDILESALAVPQSGSLALLIKSMVERQMADFDQWPIGEFHQVDEVRMRWLSMSDIDDAELREDILGVVDGQPVSGVLRTMLTLRFDDGLVPVWIAIVPRLTAEGLAMSAHVDTDVDLDSWFYQWIADLFNGDDLASKTAQSELDHALVSAFGLPPPIELGAGHQLRFAYCQSQSMSFVTGRYAAIPMYLIHDSPDGSAPVLFGPAAREEPLEVSAPLAVEFEIDAMNGILHALWRSGFLDDVLQKASLAQHFNDDPLVRELLSVRVGEVELGLPPTLWQSGVRRPDLYLGVEADVALRDRDATTPAHLFSAVGIAFRKGENAPLVADLTLDSLALTCEPEPGLFTPCYGDLVQAFRARASDVHGALSERFTELFGRIVLDRRIDLQEAIWHTEDAQVRTSEYAPTAVVRVDLYGSLRPQ